VDRLRRIGGDEDVLESRGRAGRRDAERLAEVGLRVGVDQQQPAAALGQRGPEVGDARRLGAAAL
jgi:hypothetical protein